GWALRDERPEIEARRALLKLVQLGWGRENPEFRRMYTARFIPDGTPQQLLWFSELEQASASRDNAVRLMEEFSRSDVRALLPNVGVPTTIFHAERELVVPLHEGRLLAAGIPGARFVPLPSRNHLLLEDEPAWPIFVRELGDVLGWMR